jgi:hypothetical protein
LGNWLADTLSTEEAKAAALNLLPLLKNGTYANLTNEVYKLRNEANAYHLETALINLSKKYTSKLKRSIKKGATAVEPKNNYFRNICLKNE